MEDLNCLMIILTNFKLIVKMVVLCKALKCLQEKKKTSLTSEGGKCKTVEEK
jgi:hypothetical protein